MSDQLDSAVPELIRLAFATYLERRQAFYANPAVIVRKLLRRDPMIYALRGVGSAEEFVESAFIAHEASSEETMMGNAWQAALAAIAPNSVGGGDLRTEREGTLWIIQVKMSRLQNSGAEAQDLRMLKAKLTAESDHHPGRKNVKAMLGFVRGPFANEWRMHRSKSMANADIDGFQHQYMAGSAFLNWCSADFDQESLFGSLADEIGGVRDAREKCLIEVQRLVSELLTRSNLGADFKDVLRLMATARPAT